MYTWSSVFNFSMSGIILPEFSAIAFVVKTNLVAKFQVLTLPTPLTKFLTASYKHVIIY